MNLSIIFFIIMILGVSAYFAGLKKSLVLRNDKKLNSTPSYYGSILALNSSLSAIFFIILWFVIEKNFITQLENYRNYLYLFTLVAFLISSI
ncbi:MAG: hypothetical protein CMQ81_00610, partial [Gammaproteobacteria bacterium]|nr:hypothetical protein [Gammaproteobacteria bacterium]